MNLNYDQSQDALRALLSSADAKAPSHYIAVDYDGEVIVDPQLLYPDVDLSLYKYCTQLRTASLSNSRKLQALHDTLLNVVLDYPDLDFYHLRIAA
jgi:hypothetical protein